MPFNKTARARAIFRPLCPPIAPPTTTSNTLSRMSSTPVLRIFMCPSPPSGVPKNAFKNVEQPSSAQFQERTLSLLDSRGSCGLFRWRALKAHRVPLPMAVHAHMITGQHSSFQNLQGHNALQMLFPERVKGHDLVDAVDELRPERSTQCFRRFSARQLRIFVRQFEDRGRPNVAGHHQHGVPEVHGAALAVGEAPVLQNLQQYIEYLRVGFLNFVKQNNRVRMTPDLLGELPALLVSNVARGCADEPRHAVFLHVFAHVDADHQLLIVEEELRERSRSFSSTMRS